MKIKIAVLGLLMTLSGCKPSLLEPEATDASCDFPARVGYVNDYCHLLTDGQRAKLKQSIADFHAKTGSQIIIVVEDSKKSHSKKFHTPCEISKKWHLGQPENCDDIIIAISRKRTFIDISYGLNQKLKVSKEEHRHILKDLLVPAFTDKHYYDGLQSAVDFLAAR